MFGNLYGWLGSAVIAAFTVAIILLGGVTPATTKPTGTLPAGLQSAALTTDPAAVLPRGTDSCNAGDQYRQAIATFNQPAMKRKVKAFLYEKDATKKKAAAAALHDDLEPLVKARDCSKMDLYTSKPTEALNYRNDKPDLARLEAVGNLLVSIGGFYFKDDPAQAKQYMEAAYALGRNLYQERVSFEEYRVGLAVLSNAAGTLANFGTDKSDTARIAQLQAVKTAADTALAAALPVVKGITGIGVDSEGKLKYTGDMFDIALNSKEPMWRSEALLKLGRMQYMAEVKEAADQKAAKRIVTQVASDPSAPPTVRAAATAARDLDMPTFNMIGGGGAAIGPWD